MKEKIESVSERDCNASIGKAQAKPNSYKLKKESNYEIEKNYRNVCMQLA